MNYFQVGIMIRTLPIVSGGTCDFGRKVTFVVPLDPFRGLDVTFLSDIHVCITLPELDEHHRWVPYIGEAILRKIDFEANGYRIDSHRSEYIHAYNLIHLTNEEKQLYEKMIGHTPEMYNKSYIDRHGKVRWKISEKTQIYIPLRFAFNKFKECKLPVYKMVYTELKICIEFETSHDIIQCKSDCKENVCPKALLHLDDQVELLVNYEIVGSPDDLSKLHPESLLFDSVEHNASDTINTRSSLRYNHRVSVYLPENSELKELIFMFFDPNHFYDKSPNQVCDRMDATNYFGMNALLDSARIRVDGNELLPNVPAKYFTQLQQQYHTNSNDGVYCYSFVRHPEKMDYQGGLKTNECDWMTLELIIDPNSLLSKITECNCLADSPTLCKCRNLLHSLNKDIKQKLCNEYLEFSDVIQLHVFAIKYQPVVIEKGRLSISKK